MVAIAAQSCGVGRLGFLNPALYAMARRGTGFNDVTTGDNDLHGVGAFSAGVGYDMASGLGSPNSTTFLAGLCPVALSSSHSSLTAQTASASVPGPVAVTLSARDAQGDPLIGAVVHFEATAASGLLEFDAQRASATGAGAAVYDVTTDAQGDATVNVTSAVAGPVQVSASYGTATLSTSVTFTAIATQPPGRASITRVVARVAGFTLTARRAGDERQRGDHVVPVLDHRRAGLGALLGGDAPGDGLAPRALHHLPRGRARAQRVRGRGAQRAREGDDALTRATGGPRARP